MKTVLMRVTYALSFALIFSPVVHAQQTILEEKKLASFTALDVRGPFSIELIQADQPAISIELDEKYKTLVKYEVISDALSIKWNGQTKTIKDEIRIKVYTSNISSATFDVSGSVSAASALKTKTMNIVVLNVAKMSLPFDVNRLDLTAKCNGEIQLTGRSDLFSLFNYNKGNIDASALQAKSASLINSGEGKVSVFASSQLGITATGTGTIKYYGLPGNVKISNAKNATILNAQRS
jgi:hypothetical protein